MSISSGFHPLNNMSLSHTDSEVRRRNNHLFTTAVDPDFLRHHSNVLGSDYNGMTVALDMYWPRIPEGVEVEQVWMPWNNPHGEYHDFTPERMHEFVTDYLRWRERDTVLNPPQHYEPDSVLDYDLLTDEDSVGSQESRV